MPKKTAKNTRQESSNLWFRNGTMGYYPSNTAGWGVIILTLIGLGIIVALFADPAYATMDRLLSIFSNGALLVMIALLLANFTGQRGAWLHAKPFTLAPIPTSWQGTLMMLTVLGYIIYLVAILTTNYAHDIIFDKTSPLCTPTTLLIMVWLFLKRTERN